MQSIFTYNNMNKCELPFNTEINIDNISYRVIIVHNCDLLIKNASI